MLEWLSRLFSLRAWPQVIESVTEGEVLMPETSSDSTVLDQVLIEGDKVSHHLLLGGPGGSVIPQRTVSIEQFTGVLAEQYVAQAPVSFGIIPQGMNVRDVFQANGMYIFLVQVEPGVRTVPWLADDSPAAYGAHATYREVTIALPYIYFFVVLHADGRVGGYSSVYFRNKPLTSLDHLLCDCAFYNCSVDSYGVHCWICTQGVSFSLSGEQSLAELVDSFIQWFWGSGFNASSEYHEGQSFWGKTRKVIRDERLTSISAWEKATAEDPTFAIRVPWLPAKRTPRQVYEELIAQGRVWCPASSKDFAGLFSRAPRK